MKRLLLFLIIAASMACAQDIIPAPGSKPFVYTGVLSGIPATCTVGKLAFITDATAGQQIYECSSTNTWTQQAAGGATINATNNTLPKRLSAAAFTDSALSDNGTTVTSTEPIAVSGSTAGYVDLPQGSSNGTGTTSARIQAPTGVTSYVVNVPTAAPTNNNSAMVFSNASPAVGTFSKMPQTAVTTTSYTNATTTFSNVTGTNTLQFSVEASTNYVATCNILWQGSAGTTGPKFQFTGPASPTAVAASAHSPVTTSTYLDASATAFSSSMADTGTITATTNFLSVVTLGLVNGVNAGTVTLQAAANGVGTLTIAAGSYCQLQ